MKLPHALAFGVSLLTLSISVLASDYQGLGVHDGHLLLNNRKDSLPFARKVFNDQPITPICNPSVQ
ncbi:hypothetical protein DCO48_17440 [Pseudomonas sp. SDI]|uniref:hypothetical protein n=1 Tax=Pseudomonas sp. SDI TaxID=2170734 RepID=UPI000DE77199|nr:hypothetical protein [Pseudomonas sp. SDI]PWB31442.1 hypothetical protein DCO48_17440 [Pseudomonas sp. SDI]